MQTLNKQAQVYRRLTQALAVPPPMDCLTWNRRFGRLSNRDSARPGAWSDISTPYVCHWLDCASARKLGRSFCGNHDPYAHLTEQIWIVKGTQTGLTRSLLLAILGWLMDQQPGPTGYFLPRKEDLPEVQKERLLPFWEESPQLARHLPAEGTEARKRKITDKRWHFSSGTIYYLCSSIAMDLRSRPLCDEVWDEFDQSPTNVDNQGDAISLGLERQKTFGRRRLAFGVTTPTDVANPGWRRLTSGSHERLLIDCQSCGASQELSWEGLRILDPAAGNQPLTLTKAVEAGIDSQRVMISGADGSPGLARWACALCGQLHTTRERDQITLKACRDRHWVPGEWVLNPKNPHGLWLPAADFDSGHRLTTWAKCETTIRTGHLHSLYSTFVTLCEAAAREMNLIKQGSESEWISHRNNWRAEPTLPVATQEATTPAQILSILEHKHPRYTAPAQVQKILITCDQQGNERDQCWFPYVVRGWGVRGETWLIDAGRANDWDELYALEQRLWTVGTGQRPCDAIALDGANGNVRVYVQTWAQENASKRFILHGRPNAAQPIIQRFARDARKNNPHSKRMLSGIRYYYTDPDAWKTMLNDRLKKTPGLPLWHLCHAVPDSYLASLGSEGQVRVIAAGGRAKTAWRPRTIVTPTGLEEERKDTHWWDCEHMQLAAAHVLKFDTLAEPEELNLARFDTTPGEGFLDGFDLGGG